MQKTYKETETAKLNQLKIEHLEILEIFLRLKKKKNIIKFLK